MSPHEDQGPRINLALTHIAEHCLAIWIGDVGCSDIALLLSQNEISLQESEDVMGKNFLWKYLHNFQRYTVFIEILCLFTKLILELSWNCLVSKHKPKVILAAARLQPFQDIQPGPQICWSFSENPWVFTSIGLTNLKYLEFLGRITNLRLAYIERVTGYRR